MKKFYVFFCLAILSIATSAFAAAPVLSSISDTNILEDADTISVGFTVTDSDSSLIDVSTTATSSNTNLIPHNTANLLVTGEGSTSRAISITPAADQNGSSTITVSANDGTTTTTTTFIVTVTAVDDEPVVSIVSVVTIFEDNTTNRTFTVTDVDTAISSVVTTASIDPTNLASVSITGTTNSRTLVISGLTNANGSGTITISAGDATTTNTTTLDLNITAVNDAPTFTLSTNQLIISEDLGTLNYTNFVTDVSAGATNEAGQGLNFNPLTITNSSFYATTPTLGTNGLLSFRVATNTFGTNVIQIQLKDGSGSANGGTNGSVIRSLSIIVTNVNDAPVISGLPTSKVVSEDSGTNFVFFNMTDVDNTNVTLTAIAGNTNLVTVSTGSTTTNKFVSLITVTNAYGSTPISVVANDGTVSVTNTFTYQALSANDAPTFSLVTNLLIVAEDAATQTNVNFATNLSFGPTNESPQAFAGFTITPSVSGFFSVGPVLDISSNSATLRFKPTADVAGTNVLSIQLRDSGNSANGGTNGSTVQFLTIVVTNVNDAPTMSSIPTTAINEDSGTNTINFTVADVDGNVTNITVIPSLTNSSLATLNVSGTGTNRVLTIVPSNDTSGFSTIQLVAVDDEGARSTNKFALNVNAVNDAPVFTMATNRIALLEDAGVVTITNFAMDISTGPSDESSQTFSFTFAPLTNNFFASDPSINLTNGNLTFRVTTNAFGTNVLTVRMFDSGGTANGGTNVSVTQTLTFEVAPVNDAPVISGLSSSLTVSEDSGLSSLEFIAYDPDGASEQILAGGAVGSVILNATSSNTNLATVDVIISETSSTNWILNITTVTNASGNGTITILASDGELFGTNTFNLTVQDVNDAPSFSMATNRLISAEDASTQSVTNFATSISKGATNESAQTLTFQIVNTNSAFFSTQPSINTNNGMLTYKSATNVFGTNFLSIQLKDNGNSSLGGTNGSVVRTLEIVVTNVNDAPIISTLLAKTVNEDSGTATNSFIVTDPDGDASGITTTATSLNTNLVTVSVNGTSTNRNVEIVTVTNAFGSTTIRVVATDTNNLSRTNSFTLTVVGVNDAPVLAISDNTLNSTEDAGLVTITNFVTTKSAGPTNENAQVLSYSFIITNTSFFATSPQISTNGTLTYKTSTNRFGTNVIKLQLKDSGDTANGGTNGSTAQSILVGVAAAPDAPIISGLPTGKAINEDSGTNIISFTVADPDTSSGSITTVATSLNTNIVTIVGITTTATNRQLRVATVTNAFGTNITIRIVASDGSLFRTNTFPLTIVPVNDAPSFTLSTNKVTVQKFKTLQTVTGFAQNMSKGPANESSQTLFFRCSTTNTAFFYTQPQISTNGVLTFSAGAYKGTNTVTVQLFDSGGASSGGTNGSTKFTFQVVSPINAFNVLAGGYNCLFAETNGVANNSSGFVSFTLSTNGFYSGQLKLGTNYAFSGQFDVDGIETKTIARPGLSSLNLTMALDFSSAFTERVTGTVSDGVFTSELLGDHAVYNATTRPAPQAGKYTLVFPGASGSQPAGAGYGTVTVTTGGAITLSGFLADGTGITQTTALSKDGHWPLYATFYTNKGCLLSWITLTNTGTNRISGNYSWIKTGAAGGKYYPSGFTNEQAIDGSRYVPPSPGQRAIGLTTGSIKASSGGLTGPFTNRFNLTATNTVSMIAPVTNAMTLLITTNTGFINGSFTHPVTKSSVALKGVILQDTTNARGYFLTPTLSGDILVK